jgi:tetratricopeptide (TPR) repeat protein
MTRDVKSGLRETQRWLSASIDEAQKLLPMLLALPAVELHRHVAANPPLRTAGVLHALLGVADDAIECVPHRTLVLTAVIIQHASSMEVPAGVPSMAVLLEGQAWRSRADALRRLGRLERAREAVAAARALFAKAPVNNWFLARLDLVEAPLLEEAGDRAAAMERIERAARVFGDYRDLDRYVQTVMMRASMMWGAGERDAAARFWRDASEAARERRDTALMATLEARIGLFELEHGDARHAAEMLESGLTLMDRCGLKKEAAHTRRHMAEAAAARGRVHEAISELYKVHAELVAVGAIRDAALVSTRILELLLLEGRESAVVGATEMFVRTLDGRMPSRAFDAVTWLERRARAAALSHEDVRAVGLYFEEAPENLDLQPHAWLPRTQGA